MQSKLKEEAELKRSLEQIFKEDHIVNLDRKQEQEAYREYLIKQARSQSIEKIKSTMKLSDIEANYFANELKRVDEM